jgi:hypothetical protein
MKIEQPFHETLTAVSRAYSRARRDYDQAMDRGDRDKVDTAMSRMQQIEACVDLRLKRPLPL